MAENLAGEAIRASTDFDGTERAPMRTAEARITLGVVAARQGDIEQAVHQGGQALTGPRKSLPSLVHGEANHDVAVVAAGTDYLADSHNQEGITKQPDRTLAKSGCHMTRPIAPESDAVPVNQAAEKIGGNSVTGQSEDFLGVRISVSRELCKVGRHALIITATAPRGQTRGKTQPRRPTPRNDSAHPKSTMHDERGSYHGRPS